MDAGARVFAVLFASVWALQGLTPSQALTCLPSDAVASRHVAEFQALITSVKPKDVSYRQLLGLSATKASDVSYVTDERTCNKAVAALDALWGTPPSERQVYVYRIGTDFAVEDPQVRGGEYKQITIFDRRWSRKSNMLTF